MVSTLAPRIRLADLNEHGYEALGHAQDRMRRDCLTDGGARWVPVPYETHQGVIDLATGNPGVLVGVTITSSNRAHDLSWMAAKAYSYALYTGCIDLLKRRATQVGQTRYLGVGSWQECDAMVGPVKMIVRVTVLDAADVEGGR